MDAKQVGLAGSLCRSTQSLPLPPAIVLGHPIDLQCQRLLPSSPSSSAPMGGSATSVASMPNTTAAAPPSSAPSSPLPAATQHRRCRQIQGRLKPQGISPASSVKNSRWYMINANRSGPLTVRKECRKVLPSFIAPSASYASQASEKKPKQERTDLATVEDPFDAPTYNIPEKPVTFVEGASYSVIILAGLGVAALAGYAVFKELIFEPKEYKIFGKALARVQSDSQVTAKIGYPITGYGTESRNRAARQRIQNRVWTDEDGVEHVEVGFHIRGPHGAGKVFAEMFKDSSDKTWKFTFLLVEITSPRHAQIMLESYLPA